MRPADYSDEKIIEAGKRLKSRNRKVTGYGLRNELGGGDQKRLYSVWEEYAEQETVEVLPEGELPTEIEELLGSAGQTMLSHLRSITASINQCATKAADRQVAEVTRQLKDLKEHTEAELQDAGDAITKLESEADGLREHLIALEEELKVAKGEAERHEKEAFKLEAQLQEMKGVEELIKRLEALEQKAAGDYS